MSTGEGAGSTGEVVIPRAAGYRPCPTLCYHIPINTAIWVYA